eukprot:6139787-Pyramimonas_sp.AAC.1
MPDPQRRGSAPPRDGGCTFKLGIGGEGSAPGEGGTRGYSNVYSPMRVRPAALAAKDVRHLWCRKPS